MGPCVVMASPGMMQSGLSRQLFEAWCTDKRNGVLIAGYCVEGTLAKVLMSIVAIGRSYVPIIFYIIIIFNPQSQSQLKFASFMYM